MTRGFYGIGIEHGKTVANLGTLWRTAHLFGADFMFTIGHRYHRQTSDTMKSWRSIPLWHFATLDDLIRSSPMDAPLVGVELTPAAEEIKPFRHPERAIYLLGAEDHGLTKQALTRCHRIVRLPGDHSMNVAVAGSILIFDRWQKAQAAQ
jgi:tRNA G18 (ribose-2'-O)-methylase SpoU